MKLIIKITKMLWRGIALRIKMDTYKSPERRLDEMLRIFFNPIGIEVNLCLIEQGYEDIVFINAMTLFGSGFAALAIIKDLKDEYLNGT